MGWISLWWQKCAGCAERRHEPVYRHVLQQSLLPWTKPTSQNNFVLVQDNAHTHEPLAISWRNWTWKLWIGHPKSGYEPYKKTGTWWRFISATWIIFQLRQYKCMYMCSRPGLPWGPSGIRPWYGACCVDCVLSSLRVVVLPSINQPPTMLLTPFYRLTKFRKFSMSALFATDIIHWYTLPWHTTAQFIILALQIQN